MSERSAIQRVRLTFTKGEAVKYIAHLSMMRAWERIVRRADLPIAYSQGFNPRPKLAFASALSVGYTGRAEILDLELRETTSVEEILARLDPQLPDGFAVHSAWEVPLRAPSTQSQLRRSVYHVSFAASLRADELQGKLEALLSAAGLPRERVAKGKMKRYDLRPLIDGLWYAGMDGGKHVVGMTLLSSSAGTGRVDEVVDALGLSAELRAVERIQLIFDDDIMNHDTK